MTTTLPLWPATALALGALLRATGAEVLWSSPAFVLVLDPGTGRYGVREARHLDSHYAQAALAVVGSIADCAWVLEQMTWAPTLAEAGCLLPPGQSLLHQLLRTPGADATLLRTARQVAERLPADTPVLDQVAAIAALTGDPRLAEQHAAMVKFEEGAEARAYTQLRHLTFPWLSKHAVNDLVGGTGDSEVKVAALGRAAKIRHRVSQSVWALSSLVFVLSTLLGPSVPSMAGRLALGLAAAAVFVLGALVLPRRMYWQQQVLRDWVDELRGSPTCKVRERGYAGVEAGSSLL